MEHAIFVPDQEELDKSFNDVSFGCVEAGIAKAQGGAARIAADLNIDEKILPTS